MRLGRELLLYLSKFFCYLVMAEEATKKRMGLDAVPLVSLPKSFQFVPDTALQHLLRLPPTLFHVHCTSNTPFLSQHLTSSFTAPTTTTTTAAAVLYHACSYYVWTTSIPSSTPFLQLQQQRVHRMRTRCCTHVMCAGLLRHDSTAASASGPSSWYCTTHS